MSSETKYINSNYKDFFEKKAYQKLIQIYSKQLMMN